MRFIAGINTPGLNWSGDLIHARRFCRGIAQRTGAESVATHQMREVRPESSVADGAINRMAIDASRSLENEPPGGHGRVVFGELLLLRRPIAQTPQACPHTRAAASKRVECRSRCRTVPGRARAVRAQSTWNSLCWGPGQFCPPDEAPRSYARRPRNADRGRLAAGPTLTHGHVQFIGRDDAQLGVSEFPPPLMPDHLHIQRRGRLARILDLMDDPRRGQSSGPATMRKGTVVHAASTGPLP